MSTVFTFCTLLQRAIRKGSVWLLLKWPRQWQQPWLPLTGSVLNLLDTDSAYPERANKGACHMCQNGCENTRISNFSPRFLLLCLEKLPHKWASQKCTQSAWYDRFVVPRGCCTKWIQSFRTFSTKNSCVAESNIQGQDLSPKLDS
jgi:hypothetical protein